MTEEVLALIEAQLARVEAPVVGGDWINDGGYLAVASPRVVRQLVDEVRRLRGMEVQERSVANEHPDGCHTGGSVTRDCESDGHYSCRTCSRRIEEDAPSPQALDVKSVTGPWPAGPWPSDDEERARQRGGAWSP